VMLNFSKSVPMNKQTDLLWSRVSKFPANFHFGAVQKLKPVYEVSVVISSRTDTGVHALCNSALVDIQRRGNKPPLVCHSVSFPRITRAYSRFALGLRHHTEMPVMKRDLCWALRDMLNFCLFSFRDIQFWELTFKSRYFFIQTGKMTGALVAVGQIQKLLEAQDSLALPQNLMAPAHGLFLTHVQYRDTGKKCSEYRYTHYMCM
uniref:tRNA pseudouridine synthase n=1 Tax=Cyprinus carpio TaxID=7962 RepID=A0A8C1LTN1_CYPCA